MHCVSKMIGKRPNVAVLISRIVLGGIFVYSGATKFMGIGSVVGYFSVIHIPFPMFFAWVVAIVETFGGLALIFGVATHIAALLLAITMIVAMATVTWKQGFFGGFGFTFIIFVDLISIALVGAGKYALEAKCTCASCMATKSCGCDCSGCSSCKTGEAKK